MQLTQDEMIEIYESLVKPFQHPDPMGYMTRALLLSNGDPDFVNLKGELGFMPVSPKRAFEMTGAKEVQSLQNNVIATLSMDKILFEEYEGDLERMIVSFHWEDSSGNFSSEQSDFLEEVNSERNDMKDLLYPRLATVKDVIELLEDNMVDTRLNSSKKSFFEKLLNYKK